MKIITKKLDGVKFNGRINVQKHYGDGSEKLYQQRLQVLSM